MKTQIVFEDKDILVVCKSAGIATQAGSFMQADVFSELKNYLAANSKEKREPYLGIIHRLDQPVEGVLVFAKNPTAAAGLSRQIAQRMLKKEYLAAVFIQDKKAIAENDEVTLTDYLAKDGKTNASFVTTAENADGKKAILKYRVLKEISPSVAVIAVCLETGRHHQIRVQCANAGIPLLGDQKYGTGESIQASRDLGIKDVALCAHKLTFKHPASGKKLEFCVKPQKTLLQEFGEKKTGF